MANKAKSMKEIFEEKINRERIYQHVLANDENDVKVHSNRIFKVAVSFCIIFTLMIIIGISFGKKQILKENDFRDSVKVYAFLVDEGNAFKKFEFKENIKLVLERYNLAMSMVPGYPIAFDFNERNPLDYIMVQVINGEILYWDQTTGNLDLLSNPYKITQNTTFYFHISKDSSIQVTGYFKNEKVVFKTIQILSDDDFNLYGIMN